MKTVGKILALGLALWAGQATAEDLTIATSADYPPWESVDGTGKIVGMDIDVGMEACKRINATCKFVDQGFDGLLPALNIGKFDMVISALSMSKQRMDRVDFSTPYAKSSSRVVVVDGSDLNDQSTKEDLISAMSGKTVGTQVGSAQTGAVVANFEGATNREYERADQMFDDLRAGRVDGIMLIETAAVDIMKTESGRGTKFAGPSFTGKVLPELGMGFGIAVKKGNAELKARLDKAVESMIADGTIKTLSEKHLGKDVTP